MTQLVGTRVKGDTLRVDPAAFTPPSAISTFLEGNSHIGVNTSILRSNLECYSWSLFQSHTHITHTIATEFASVPASLRCSSGVRGCCCDGCFFMCVGKNEYQYYRGGTGSRSRAGLYPRLPSRSTLWPTSFHAPARYVCHMIFVSNFIITADGPDGRVRADRRCCS